MAAEQGIDIGGIYADLDIRTGNLDKGLAKGRKALDAIAKEVDQLDKEFSDGAISAAAYGARLAALGTTATELTTRMNAAYTATTTLSTGLEIVNQNANKMTQASGRMGQGLMQLGYIADDLQYGFSGVVNNIGPMAHGFGASPQWAAGLQLVAVAAYQLYVNWDDLMDVMDLGKVRTETEEMERLAKATKLTADEQERLNRYKREQKIGKELSEKQSESVEKSQQAVKDVISELGDEEATGRTKLINGLITSRRKRGEGAKIDPEEQEQLDTIERDFGGTAYGEQLRAKKLAAIQERRDAEDARRAAKTVDTAVFDPTRRKELINEIARNPGAFPKGALEDFRNLKPELTKEEKKVKVAQDKQRAARERAIGRQAFLEEQAPGTLTEEETIELQRLQKEDAEQAARKKRAARQRAIGRKAFLEEQAPGTLTEEETVELRRLQKEDAERKKREKQQADDKKKREAEQLARENLRLGKEAAPGDIKARANVLAMQEATGMIAPGAALAQITKALEANGATKEQAVAAGQEIHSDAKKDMEKGITNRMLGEREEQRRTSQVFDATSLATQFQSSVGGDETKKQTTILEKLEKTVDMLAKSGKLVKIKK